MIQINFIGYEKTDLNRLSLSFLSIFNYQNYVFSSGI